MKRSPTLCRNRGAGLLRLHASHHDQNPYANPFYARYLNTGSPLDAQITRHGQCAAGESALRQPAQQLGQLLLQKGFPKDAEMEFERAVNADSHFYPAWYNLGLVRMSRGDWSGVAFRVRPHGPLQARPFGGAVPARPDGRETQSSGAAIDYYAKAFAINHSLLDVRVNPRILDSKLIDLALLKAYPKEHARESMSFQATPPGYVQQGLEAPSTQPAAKDIVTPAPR